MIGISREAILNWIAGAGLSPDQMRELLREEEPESVWERFQKTGVLIPEKKLAVRDLFGQSVPCAAERPAGRTGRPVLLGKPGSSEEFDRVHRRQPERRL